MSPLRVRTWHRRSSSLIKAYFDTCVFQARRLRFSSCSTEELANIKVRSLCGGKGDDYWETQYSRTCCTHNSRM